MKQKLMKLTKPLKLLKPFKLLFFLRRSLAFLEFLNASASIENFFFSSEERVARAANFHLKFFHGGPYGKFLPAGADSLCFRIVCRMYIGFHRLKSNRNMPFWQSLPLLIGSCG